MKPTFEFAALKFLMLWERIEKHLHKALNTAPQPADVRSALNHFGIPRNFKGIKEDTTCFLVLKHLATADKKTGYCEEEKVECLAELFLESFQTKNVSAASKLLWLLRRDPYIIFDSHAVNAIATLTNTKSFKGYREYCEAWREQYNRMQTPVQAATQRLLSIEAFTASWGLSGDSLSSLVVAPWFLKRVFDIYLWEFGEQGLGSTT